MRTILILALLLVASPTVADQHLTQQQVLELMARVPEKAHPSRVGHYDQAGDAREIATGIANAAPSRDAASLAVVYAAYESSNQKCAVGDQGRSLGAFQLQSSRQRPRQARP